MLLKNGNFGLKSKLWPKIKFGLGIEVRVKIEGYVKKRNYVRKIEF